MEHPGAEGSGGPAEARQARGARVHATGTEGTEYSIEGLETGRGRPGRLFIVIQVWHRLFVQDCGSNQV